MLNGKYIIFIDSDDYLNKEMLEKLYEVIKNNDMSICGFGYMHGQKVQTTDIIANNKEFDRKYFFDNLITGCYKGYLWNKLIKKDIISKYKIRFQENLRVCEDLSFIIDYAEKCSKYVYISEPLYYYRIHAESTMNSNIIEQKHNELKGMEYSIELLKKVNESSVYVDYQSVYILEAMDYIFNYGEDKNIRKIVEDYLREGCIKKERNLTLKMKLIIAVYFPWLAKIIKKLHR